MLRSIKALIGALILVAFGASLYKPSQVSWPGLCRRARRTARAASSTKPYCDRDGDMVADTPTDPKKLVDPPTLIFACSPVEDPAVYVKAWKASSSTWRR